MSADQDLVTVFRSGDTSAQEDAETVRELLEDAGLKPVLLNDEAPDVPSGAFAVVVPAAEAAKAEALIRTAEEAPAEAGDPSHDMDLETLFSAVGATAEVEALGVRNVLDANGIPYIFISPPQYPNLRFVVKVPRKHVEAARQALADAQAAGPEAAEEAEQSTES